MRNLLCTIAITALLTPSAFAQSPGLFQNAAQKTDEKKSVRWSLADWMAQKQRIRMADLWLARNSYSSPFEFFAEARSINYGLKTSSTPDQSTNHNLYGGSFAAYAGIAGLRGTYDSDSEKRSAWSGSFNLRIFGQALQDTHINIEYGIRGSQLKSAGDYSNQFTSVSTNLYLAKYFGLEGSYSKILSAESDDDRKMKGEEARAGVFIDFSFLRVFGHWKQELIYFEGAGVSSSQEKREGFGGGLRFYF